MPPKLCMNFIFLEIHKDFSFLLLNFRKKEAAEVRDDHKVGRSVEEVSELHIENCCQVHNGEDLHAIRLVSLVWTPLTSLGKFCSLEV